MQNVDKTPKYCLGLDIGSASLGWALIELDGREEPIGLIRSGVRIFTPGVEGSALDIEQGKDKSKAVNRREARLHRRQVRRRAARQRELFALLQTNRFLPQFPAEPDKSNSVQRHELLTDLDKAIRVNLLNSAGEETKAINELLPYVLRKQALDRKLEPMELGRVLYHLSQRRGFKSNRREGRKSEDKAKELGQVKQGISDLERDIAATSARTLGEFFSKLDPHTVRVRRRWTARAMYEREFEAIWTAQAPHYPGLLTLELKSEVARLLFYQRPIASQEHLIGFCDLEKNERRAPWWSLEAQCFRILQKVNDLEIIPPGHLEGSKLSGEQRELVLLCLEEKGDQKFTDLKKLLKLPPRWQFNLERGDERKLRGNRTNELMLRIFGAQWKELAYEEQAALVQRWAKTESHEELIEFGMSEWALSEEKAKEWAETEPEDGYCNLSLVALRKLLPIMADGVAFKTAEKQKYGDRFSGMEAKDKLPPVREAVPSLRNPAVERALTEVRKVVNAIVREYGKPFEIRLEMARELRKPRKERVQDVKSNRNRERERTQAKERILRECGMQNPSRADIERALLFEECGGICPYTGRSIEFGDLFGGGSQFDVEHIIPLSRCPDDSFINKTLCYHDENRRVKRGRTPWEAYSSDDQRWSEIIARVEKFGNPAKTHRFQLRTEIELEEFTARQMNDTRYTTRLAADLLAELYGGRDVTREDGSKRRAITATSGKVTATLRRRWKLESILREAAPAATANVKGKPRTDHRHHAVDAIVIALTSQSAIQRLSTAAAQAQNEGNSRSFESVSSPWAYFVDSIRPHIESMVVSHRPEHKMSGALHKETNYGKPRHDGKKNYVHMRVAVSSLKSDGDIESIVDPVVREAVRTKAKGLDFDLSKCETTEDWPVLTANTGRTIPIRKVRIRRTLEVTPIATGERQRFVQPGANHHAEVFAELDEHGREARWDSISVSLLEATNRTRKKVPVVQRHYPEAGEYQFKFSLMGGDAIELHRNCNHTANICRSELYRLRTIAENGQLSLVPVNDARLKKEMQAAKQWWSPRVEALRKLDARKVIVDLLGRVHPAND